MSERRMPPFSPCATLFNHYCSARETADSPVAAVSRDAGLSQSPEPLAANSISHALDDSSVPYVRDFSPDDYGFDDGVSGSPIAQPHGASAL